MAQFPLIDQASLVMIPGAYKEGKIYSQLPTDGSGDFTYTRGTDTATRVNENGLIEKERVNLLLQSNQFDTAWGYVSASAASGYSGYDGSSDAWLLTKTGVSGRVYQNLSTSGVLTYSVYMKANASTWGLIQVDGSPSDAYVYVDLSNGVFGSVSSHNITESLEDIGNGWYRVSLSVNDTATRVRIYPAETNSASATSGSIYIQDAQLEQGLVSTDYIETTTVPVYAGLTDNMPRLDYSGGASCPSLLLEPSRTNLVGQSEYFGGSYWTIGGASFVSGLSSPEGLSNAYEFKEGTNAGAHFFYDNGFIIVNGTSYTMSVFVKYNGRQWFRLWGQFGNSNQQAYFDVQNGVTGSKDAGVVSGIEDYGNGWYRVYLTATSDGTAGRYRGYLAITDGNPSYQGDDTSGVYLYGATFEQGSYPTSYIPTYGSSVTRSADLTDRGANLSYTGNYTLFMEFNLTEDAAYILNATTLSAWSMYVEGSFASFQFGRTGGDAGSVSFASSFDWSAAIGTNVKIALVKNGTSAAMFVNGTKYTPSANTLSTGNEVFDWRYLNYTTTTTRHKQNYINQLLEFEEALTDSECIALTTI